MKQHSIRHWITRWFIAILFLSMVISAVANLYEAYSSTMQSGREWASLCAYDMRNLLDHQWSLEELSGSAESEEYMNARRITQNLCRNYEMDYIYVYTVDPEKAVRYYYLCVSNDPEKDCELQEYALSEGDRVDLMPGEKAILAGSDEMQEEVLHNWFGNEVTWIVPYYDTEGVLRAMIGMDYSLTRLRQEILECFLSDIIPFMISLSVGFLILLLLVRRRIVNPLHAISESMKIFSQDSSKKPETLRITSGDEIGEIAATYEKMTGEISEYIHNIEMLTRKQVETDVQLDVARHIQYGLVPERTNLKGEGFEISAMTKPAKAVGGDFYDCFKRSDDSVCIVMGDVSGKGIYAAIFMAMAKTMIREKLMAGLSPAETLNQANNALCGQNPEGLFVTVFAAVLNPFTGELCYANAGHTFPVLLGEMIRVLEPESGIALGLFEDADLSDHVLRLSESEGILLYTDGVTEAVDSQKEFFGMDRLLNTLKAAAEKTDTGAGRNTGKDAPEGGNAEETLFAIDRAVQRYCEGNEPFDDMAALVLFRTCTSDDRQELPVSLSSLDEIRKAVFETVGEGPEARKVILACDEVLTNIVRYSGAGSLLFSCRKQEEELCITFSDDGIPFDPTAFRTEEKDFELLDCGGMGLNIVRETVSGMHYQRKDGRNELVLSFI